MLLGTLPEPARRSRGPLGPKRRRVSGMAEEEGGGRGGKGGGSLLLSVLAQAVVPFPSHAPGKASAVSTRKEKTRKTVCVKKKKIAAAISAQRPGFSLP